MPDTPDPAAGVYILAVLPDRYWLVGPFASYDVAEDWLFENGPGPDREAPVPEARILHLSTPFAAPTVLPPRAGAMEG